MCCIGCCTGRSAGSLHTCQQTCECRNGAQSAALHDGPSKMLDRQVQLHAFMLARLQEMQSAIEQKAIADFNNWLVCYSHCRQRESM